MTRQDDSDLDSHTSLSCTFTLSNMSALSDTDTITVSPPPSQIKLEQTSTAMPNETIDIKADPDAKMEETVKRIQEQSQRQVDGRPPSRTLAEDHNSPSTGSNTPSRLTQRALATSQSHDPSASPLWQSFAPSAPSPSFALCE